MKLNNICEDKKFDKMMRWCSNNIFDFFDKYGRDEIKIDEKENKIIGSDISIITKEEKIPYQIFGDGVLEITGSNLNSFENLMNLDTVMVVFYKNNMLDFHKIDTLETLGHDMFDFNFFSNTKLEASMFRDAMFTSLYFHKCMSNTLYDFSQYVNNETIDMFGIIGNYKIKNLTYLLNDYVYITHVDFENLDSIGEEVSDIINKYLHNKNKSDYVMDFTVELLDKDVDESIL